MNDLIPRVAASAVAIDAGRDGSPALEVSGLTKKFGDRTVVDDTIDEVIGSGGQSISFECDDPSLARQLLLVHRFAQTGRRRAEPGSHRRHPR